jgi:apolipoprotein N-acyltransferase
MERLAGWVILLWGWRRTLTAFLAGAFAVLAQAPYDFIAVCFISFPVLVWLLDGATASHRPGFFRKILPAFSIGWWFGFGYFLAGLWWIGGAVLIEAEDFAWALPFAVLGVPLMMAFFYGFATALARLLWTDGIGRIFALAFAFGIAEWLRTFVLTGFPWNAIGYAAMPIPLLMQSVSVVSMTAMNALAVFVFAMPALLAARKHLRTGMVLAVLLIATHVGYGYWRLSVEIAPAEKTLALRIVQPSIDLNEKWDGAVRDRIFRTMLEFSSQPAEADAPKPQLILWPETAVPFLFTDRPDALVALGELLQDGQMLITGTIREEGGRGANAAARYYNSVVAINDKGEIVDAVDKVHLVPFGEYLPLSDWLARIGLTQIVAGPMDLSAGSERHALMLPGGIGALPFICYEIIFPALVAKDAASSDLLLNVTNDAWFGDTPGPYQHFRQAQIRAVETGKPLVRAANNGISGIVDERGRIIDALAINARGVIDAEVPIRPANVTEYHQQRLIGVVILLVFCLVSTFTFIRRKFRPN